MVSRRHEERFKSFGSPAIDLDALPKVPAWTEAALCAQIDQEVFYPDKGGPARDAKAVCSACPVSAACLDYALANNEHYGVWGGLTERERRQVARERGVA